MQCATIDSINSSSQKVTMDVKNTLLFIIYFSGIKMQAAALIMLLMWMTSGSFSIRMHSLQGIPKLFMLNNHKLIINLYYT